jgi:hypothetical protein
MKSKVVSVIVLICLLALVLCACEPRADWQIENGTAQTLQVFIARGFEGFKLFDVNSSWGWVEPGQKLEAVTQMDTPFFRVQAYDSLNNLVWSKNFTREELVESLWVVTISHPD